MLLLLLLTDIVGATEATGGLPPKLTGAMGGRGGLGTAGSDGTVGRPGARTPVKSAAGARMGVVMGPFPPSWLLLPGESASGACRVSELASNWEFGELSANEHCVLQMLSLRTAS